ncbi:uncharacterized protein LOC121982506 isoform X1 [Zingiber officinale]|uniref:uncharacterized protein LOC121982506 isoform X1 n=1 Tax=Zingiber officinale TaxID=94328 RepID=UPI001C4A7AAA|nr:uncharacterized protein LOC121982506 isoform X1 [Zingiber officinale]
MEEGSSLGGELEITSIGAIYCGPWDKKYWSSSRGKDRYPYPVGYHAVRTHGGNIYQMEIREGVKGPLFMVASTDGESSTGHTPDIAWVNFQKNVPRVKTGNGKRFSSKIDGIQLFGFRNPFVQRLLRELVANIQGVAEPDMVLPTDKNEVPRLDKMMQPPDSFVCSDLLDHTDKHLNAGKRGVRDKVCTRDRNKTVRAKRICYHHVTNDSRAGNLEKENVMFSHSKINDQNFIKEKSLLSSRNHIIQIQDSQHHPGFLPKSAAAASDDTCQQIADCKCRGIFNQIPERNILSQEMGDSDNSVDKHVIYVRENNSTGQDPCPTGVNNVSDDDNSTKNAIRLSNAGMSPSGVLPKAVESGEMLASENYSELYISDTCDVEKSHCLLGDAADFQSVRGSSTCINPGPECSSLRDAALKGFVNDSIPETGPLSGSSNSGSEKADLSASDKELANSMISFLLPRAVPLLEKTYVRRKSRYGSQAVRLGATLTLFKASSAEHMAKNDQSTDKIYEEGLDANRLMNGTQEKVPQTLNYQISISCQMAKMEDAIDDCLPHKTSDHTLYLEDPKNMIPDSYEDDKYVCDVHPNEHTNVACESECKASAESRENNNITNLNILGESSGKPLDSEVLFPKETIKNEYLTDSLVEYLEEAFNDDLRLEKERSDADCLGVSVNHNLPYLNSDVVNHEEKEISESMLHYNNGKWKMKCMGQCSTAANASSNNLNEGDMCALATLVEVPQNKNGKTSKDIQSLVLDNQIEFAVLDATEQKVCEVGDQTGFNHALAVESTNVLLVNVNGDKMLLSDDGQHTDRTNKCQRLSNKSQFSGNCNVPFSESIICRNYMDSDVTATRPTEISRSVQTKLTCYQSNSAVVSQSQNVTDYVDVNMKHSEFHDHSVNRTEENDSTSKPHPSFQFCQQAYQGPVNCVPSQNIEVTELLSFSDEKPATRNIRHEQTNICQRQPNSNDQFDDSLFRAVRLDEVLDESFELAGCYRQPKPVLFILLRPYEDDLQISVICGIRESDERFVFIYKVPLKDQGEICPYFIGYTSLMLPLLPGPAIGNTMYKGSCLQFTPDGQSIVFVSTIRAPLCRTQSMHCSCSMCTSVCCEENAVLIGKVFMGYVLPSATLTTIESLSCIAVYEPNYVIAAELSGTLRVWLMNCNWSKSLEEFVLPSFDYLRPAVELKTVPKSDCLLVGHNGIGSFGLWNISKRVLLSRFLNPGNLIFQILPIGMFNFQDEINTSSCQNMKLMQEISHHRVAEAVATPLQDDNAVWILVSADTDSDPQVVNHPKERQPTSNASWRPALLVRNIVVMGHMVDFRASSVDVSDGYGFIGTHDGVLYKWELSTGKKLSNLLRVQSGSIMCTAVDSKSGVVAVADEKCRLLILRQKIM